MIAVLFVKNATGRDFNEKCGGKNKKWLEIVKGIRLPGPYPLISSRRMSLLL
jgi:hypothetical protein